MTPSSARGTHRGSAEPVRWWPLPRMFRRRHPSRPLASSDRSASPEMSGRCHLMCDVRHRPNDRHDRHGRHGRHLLEVHFMEFTSGYIMTRYCDASRLLRHRSIGSTADNATSTPTIDAERARLRRIRLGRTSVSAQHSPAARSNRDPAHHSTIPEPDARRRAHLRAPRGPARRRPARRHRVIDSPGQISTLADGSMRRPTAHC